ncbi:MAG: hypothetical protein PUF72_00960 [Clostridiales bacterium]|nr:hypothetical protein [Clostridiales bacterium]
MSEEKNFNNEENEETASQTEQEETVEVTAEAVEDDVVEETAETVEDEAVEENQESSDENNEGAGEEEQAEADEAADVAAVFDHSDAVSAEEEKKPNGKIIGIIAAAVVVVAIALVLIFFGKNLFNKYNRMGYIDTTGRTIGEVADANGYELQDFLAEFELPSDMPENTYESVAYYMIPARKVAQMYGMDFAGLKEMLKWDDSITEETPWGEAEGETTLGAYVGEDNVESFKEQYGMGEEVTAETKWKEIRNIVDQQARDERLESEKAQKEAENATEAPAEGEAEGEGAEATEAPAPEEAAE